MLPHGEAYPAKLRVGVEHVVGGIRVHLLVVRLEKSKSKWISYVANVQTTANT